jgi:hypothetical protein
MGDVFLENRFDFFPVGVPIKETFGFLKPIIPKVSLSIFFSAIHHTLSFLSLLDNRFRFCLLRWFHN